MPQSIEEEFKKIQLLAASCLLVPAPLAFLLIALPSEQNEGMGTLLGSLAAVPMVLILIGRWLGSRRVVLDDLDAAIDLAFARFRSSYLIVFVCVHFTCLLGFSATALTGTQWWYLTYCTVSMLVMAISFPTRARLTHIVPDTHRPAFVERMGW